MWKADIAALLERKQISQAELARRIGARPSAIVALFKPHTTQSRLVPAIHRVLGLEDPGTTMISERDDLKRRLDRAWRSLSEEERELVLQLVTRIQRQPH